MKKPNHYNQVINVLQELHKSYPTYCIGRHISTAVADYGDVWGLTDKEFLFALQKYQSELDINTLPEEDIDKIVREGMDLDNMTFDNEEEEDVYGDI